MDGEYPTIWHDLKEVDTVAQPTPGERVMVETANYRCLGYLGLDGVWRRSFDDSPVGPVIGWERIAPAPRSQIIRSPVK